MGEMTDSCEVSSSTPQPLSHKRKRGSYATYNDDQRLMAAKYAIENNPTKASRWFSKEFGQKISESTIRSWMKKLKFPDLSPGLPYAEGCTTCTTTKSLAGEIVQRSPSPRNCKRGNYHSYNDEQRLIVAQYAAKYTIKKAVKKFSKAFRRKIGLSTVQGWMKKHNLSELSVGLRRHKTAISFHNDISPNNASLPPPRKHKRKGYINFNLQQRLKAAWYASRHSLRKAVRKFSKEYGRRVSESTVRCWVNKYRSQVKTGVPFIGKFADGDRLEVARYAAEHTLKETTEKYSKEFGRKMHFTTIHNWVRRYKSKLKLKKYRVVRNCNGKKPTKHGFCPANGPLDRSNVATASPAFGYNTQPAADDTELSTPDELVRNFGNLQLPLVPVASWTEDKSSIEDAISSVESKQKENEVRILRNNLLQEQVSVLGTAHHDRQVGEESNELSSDLVIAWTVSNQSPSDGASSLEDVLQLKVFFAETDGDVLQQEVLIEENAEEKIDEEKDDGNVTLPQMPLCCNDEQKTCTLYIEEAQQHT
uniref:uncharacterized protein n=1 Tax=Myxine glutinosa TaxID=7769 RepID=UPI00358FA627